MGILLVGCLSEERVEPEPEPDTADPEDAIEPGPEPDATERPDADVDVDVDVDLRDADGSGQTPQPVPCGGSSPGTIDANGCGEGRFCLVEPGDDCSSNSVGQCAEVPLDCPPPADADRTRALCPQLALDAGLVAPNTAWVYPSACEARRSGYRWALDGSDGCDSLPQEWRAIVPTSSVSCATDEDCIVVGGTGTCDCAPAIGNGEGDLIGRELLATLGPYFDRYRWCIEEGRWPEFDICDAAPLATSCVSGFCERRQRSCFGEPDAGP